MNRLACLAAALALLSIQAHAAPAPNELPSIPAPNGVVRATPSAIIIPEDPATPGGTGCVAGSTGCALAVTMGAVPAGGATAANQTAVIGTKGGATGTQGNRALGTDATSDYQLRTDSTGVLTSPNASNTQRVVTKTSVAASTSTTVCPGVALTNAISTEVQVQSGGIGLGLNGQVLSSVSWGTASGNPDVVMNAAGERYVFLVPATNAVTAYGAAQVVICIQHLRR